MPSNSELACVYATLILADDDVPVTGEKLQTILKAANVDVEPYWPGLFAKALEGNNIKSLISSVSSGFGAGGVAAAPVAASAAAAAPVEAAKEEKKKESEPEESDDDMGLGLFD